MNLVITFIGPDRPGIVNALSRVVAEHSGNWEQSRMASLAGRFAGILQVEVAEERADALIAALNELPDLSLHVDRGDSSPSATAGRAVHLHVTGADRPGIVRDVASALAVRNVNIEELTSEQVSAPMSGDQMFVAFVRIYIPSGPTLDDIAGAIEALADDLVVEFSTADEE